MNCLKEYLPLSLIEDQLSLISQLMPVKILLFDSQGNIVVSAGWKDNAEMSAHKQEGGTPIAIHGKKIGVLFWKTGDNVYDKDKINRFMSNLALQYQYIIEGKKEEQNELTKDYGHRVVMNGNKEDSLTGVFENEYFMNRVRVIDRAGVVPVALVCVNINDWRYANIHFGDEESDRLIAIVGSVLRENAKPEYVIGRTDGDVFHVVIPMVEENEEIEFINKVQTACDTYEDQILSPSVACGALVKYNVEQHLEEMFDDVQYCMFENKLEMKNNPEYRKRLTRNS